MSLNRHLLRLGAHYYNESRIAAIAPNSQGDYGIIRNVEKVATDIYTFSELRENGFTYVDKTDALLHMASGEALWDEADFGHKRRILRIFNRTFVIKDKINP